MLVNYKPYNAGLIDNPSVTLPEYVIVPDSGNITINLPIESDFEPMKELLNLLLLVLRAQETFRKKISINLVTSLM